jgi:hypothetical protein
MWNLGSGEPFGGAFCLLVGDRHQSLPVIKGGNSDEATLFSLCRSSELFSYFTTIQLTLAQRTKDDKPFDDWLAAVSVNTADGPLRPPDGTLPPTQRRIYLPKKCYKTTSLDDALEWLWGPPPPEEGPWPILNPQYAFLSYLNKDVDIINAVVLDKYIGGEAFHLQASHELSEDSAGNEDNVARVHATLEYMQRMSESGVPPNIVSVKTGCVVLLTRNLLATQGLVNGTKLMVMSEAPEEGGDAHYILHCRTIPRGNEIAQDVWLPKIAFEMTTPGGLKVTRRQFPIRLAYSMTCNKVSSS